MIAEQKQQIRQTRLLALLVLAILIWGLSKFVITPRLNVQTETNTQTAVTLTAAARMESVYSNLVKEAPLAAANAQALSILAKKYPSTVNAISVSDAFYAAAAAAGIPNTAISAVRVDAQTSKTSLKVPKASAMAAKLTSQMLQQQYSFTITTTSPGEAIQAISKLLTQPRTFTIDSTKTTKGTKNQGKITTTYYSTVVTGRVFLLPEPDAAMVSSALNEAQALQQKS